MCPCVCVLSYKRTTWTCTQRCPRGSWKIRQGESLSLTLSATLSLSRSLLLDWQRCFLGFTGGRGWFWRRQHVTCFPWLFFLQSIIFCLKIKKKKTVTKCVLCCCHLVFFFFHLWQWNMTVQCTASLLSLLSKHTSPGRELTYLCSLALWSHPYAIYTTTALMSPPTLAGSIERESDVCNVNVFFSHTLKTNLHTIKWQLLLQKYRNKSS